MTGRSRPDAARAVPRVQRVGGGAERREPGREVDEIGVVAVVGPGLPTTQVLAPQAESGVAREPARGVAADRRDPSARARRARRRASRTTARSRGSTIGGSGCRIRPRARCRRRRRPWRARRSVCRPGSRGRTPRRGRRRRRRASRARVGGRSSPTAAATRPPCSGNRGMTAIRCSSGDRRSASASVSAACRDHRY